jgi:hypothetical protein
VAVVADIEQTPALPDEVMDVARRAAHRVRDIWRRELHADPDAVDSMMARAAEDAVRAVLADRTVLECQSADEQWFVWAGGPDPDNAAMRCLRDDEADAREYWQWVHTESGSGIARRSVYYGPWEIVASESTGSGESGE